MTTASPEVQRKSLRDLRKSDATLFCKNNTGTIITCNTKDLRFEIEPFEITILPKECLDLPRMQKLWMRKAVTISDDEEMENNMILHMGGIVEMTGPRPVQVMRDDGTWTLETPKLEEISERRDIVMKLDEKGQPITPKCIIGGEPIFQTKQQLDDGQPPLCPLHENETHKIVSIQNQDGSWTHKLPTIG